MSQLQLEGGQRDNQRLERCQTHIPIIRDGILLILVVGRGWVAREGPARNWFGLAVEAGSLKGKELVCGYGGERAQGPHLLSCISNIIA